MPHPSFVYGSPYREPIYKPLPPTEDIKGIYTTLKEVEKAEGSDLDVNMEDSEYETRAKVKRVSPAVMVPLNEEQVQMIVSVLSMVKDLRQRLH